MTGGRQTYLRQMTAGQIQIEQRLLRGNGLNQARVIVLDLADPRAHWPTRHRL